MKKLSVVIPSYNHGKFLKKAIDSVLDQTFKDFDLIIVDDASTDNSKKVINSYKDSRIIKYFNGVNEGAVLTLNKLIDFANSEYVAILNSDDFWEPDKLEKQINYLESHKKVAACFTWVDFVDENDSLVIENEFFDINIFHKENRKRSEWFRYFFEYGNCLCHPSVMIRKEIYDKIGKYKNTFKQLPDFEFWIRLIKEYDIHILEENLTHFRLLSGDVKNTSNLNEKSFNLILYETFKIKNSFFDNCSYKFFCEAFSDKILKKFEKDDDISFEFEKALIQYDCHYYRQLGRLIGYEAIGKLFENELYYNKIMKKYDFSMKDYYKMGQDVVALDNVIFDQEVVIIEKVPDYMKNSRYFKMCDFVFKNKFTGKLLKLFRRN